jgi:co-chaperonin GroES (HSP10)
VEEYDPPRGAFVHGWPYFVRERMRLIPHGFSVLIEPDPPPEQTDSGLILMPEDRTHMATSGVVVAVGKGSKRLWDERQKAYRKALAAIDRLIVSPMDVVLNARDAVWMAMQEREPTPSVHVGDRVVFAAEAGLTVNDDGKDYILLEEDRVVIVVEEEESAVA